ncbi:MAG: thiamine pyrophosphate-dependent enzyme [Candidatus Shikimatogenerans bostrichidophilus]|nr:MAG: thiamine pyrophosphate-dependent enzyme [Candidatus Shikimatogenerans bostrichidophilus]
MNFLKKKKININYKKIKWCIGCGNYSIIMQLKIILNKLKIKKNKIVLVSGIGCSSRLPYFLNVSGIHSIHGRSFSIATGIKIANPKLNVWVITGDGDSFSIGLSNLLHTIRKNININILIFNNEIYGLTKGQKSFTNKNKNNNFNTISLILSSGSTFIARSIDNNINHLKKILKKANKHIGTSCIEIYQNCPIFNKNFLKKLNIKNTNKYIILKNKKPLLFNNKKKGIILKNNIPKIVKLKNYSINDLWIHNENDIYKAYILSNFKKIQKKLPIPFGIFYKKKIKINKKKKTKNKKINNNLFFKILKKKLYDII